MYCIYIFVLKKAGNVSEIYFWTTTMFRRKLHQQICEGGEGWSAGSSGTASKLNQFYFSSSLKLNWDSIFFVFCFVVHSDYYCLFFLQFYEKTHRCLFFVTLVNGDKRGCGGGVITRVDGIKAGYKDSLLGIGYCWVYPRFTAQYMEPAEHNVSTLDRASFQDRRL